MIFRPIAVIAACAALGLGAQASPVTVVPGGIDLKVITFVGFDLVSAPTTLSGVVDVGSAEIGEVVNLSFSPDGEPRVLGAVPQDLGANGDWPGSGAAYAGLLAASAEMTFRFASGMNFVGGFVNYNPGSFDGSPTLTALADDGSPLEDLSLNFVFNLPDGQGLGQFHGFVRPNADIFGLKLSNGFAVIDNLSFGTTRDTPVPTPASWALLLTAFLSLAWVMKRGRGQSALVSRASRT